MENRLFASTRPLLAALCVAALSTTEYVSAMEWVHQPPEQVGRYGQFEAGFRLDQPLGNPWATDAEVLGAAFVSPSGREVRVPAFQTQDFRIEALAPRAWQSAVTGLKVYVTARDWSGAGSVTLFLDDVRLVPAGGGQAKPVGDFEAGPEGWSAQGCTAVVTDETAATGSHSLRADIAFSREVRGPGVSLAVGQQDWSAYDEIRFKVLVRAAPQTTAPLADGVQRAAPQTTAPLADGVQRAAPQTTPPLADGARRADVPQGRIRAECVTADGQTIRAGDAMNDAVAAGQWTEVVWDLAHTRGASGRPPVPEGDPYFAVRFMPQEPGEHTFRLVQAGRVLHEGRFRCVESGLPAPVRVSRKDPTYFELVDGTPWLAVGLNMCWASGGRTHDYERWLPRLAQAGGNFVRLWMCPWCFGIEWGGPAGVYRTAEAYELDAVMRRAQELGIRVMLCLDYHGALVPNENWPSNPYNAAQGGPCAEPRQFFTDETAVRLYMQRLRYLAARYGSYGNLAAWEFFNEVDLTDAFDAETVAAWHGRMGRYLRSIDPYEHARTTSYAAPAGDPVISRVPEVEFVQTHDYASTDWAEDVAYWIRSNRELFGKPAIIGEFGLTGGQDAEGMYLHNALWASVMSGSAATALIWPWDNYVDARDLYHHYASLARFANGVNWTQGLRPLDSCMFGPEGGPADEFIGAAFIEGTRSAWEPAPFNAPHTFTVSPEGAVDQPELLCRVLHSQKRTDLTNTPTFVVDFRTDGEFMVCVNGVSGWGGANLKILVDGQERFAKEFADTGPSTGDIRAYNGVYRVPVEAGQHRITVVDDGADWMRVSYAIRNTWRSETANARAFGLTGPEETLVWLQNREFTWPNVGLFGVQPAPVRAGVLRLPTLAPGSYEVLVWDTWKGEEISRTVATATHGLSINVPAFDKALAFRVRLVR